MSRIEETTSTFDVDLAFNDSFDFTESLSVIELTPGFFQFNQELISATNNEEVTKGQQLIFDTNGGWFSSSYDGSVNFFVSSIGQGDIVSREWPDDDLWISQNVTISEGLFEQTIYSFDFILTQTADMYDRTWSRSLTLFDGQYYTHEWEFLVDDKIEKPEQVELIEIETLDEPTGQGLNQSLSFNGTNVMNQTLFTSEGALSHEMAWSSTDFIIVYLLDDDRSLTLVVSSANTGESLIIYETCLPEQAVCYTDFVEYGDLTFTASLDSEAGVIQLLARESRLGLEVYTEMDFLSEEQVWRQTVLHEKTSSMAQTEHTFLIELELGETKALAGGGTIHRLERGNSVQSDMTFGDPFWDMVVNETITVSEPRLFEFEYSVTFYGLTEDFKAMAYLRDDGAATFDLTDFGSQDLSCDNQPVFSQLNFNGFSVDAVMSCSEDEAKLMFILTDFYGGNVSIQHQIQFLAQEWQQSIQELSVDLPTDFTWNYKVPGESSQSQSEAPQVDHKGESHDSGYQTEIVFEEAVLIKNHLSAINETTLHQSLYVTDHEGYYHSVWQSLTLNNGTDWEQSVYYDGEEVFSLGATFEDGITSRDDQLSSDFRLLQLLNLKSSGVRQEFHLDDFKLELVQKLNVFDMTLSVRLLSEQGEELFQERIDLMELEPFTGIAPKNATQEESLDNSSANETGNSTSNTTETSQGASNSTSNTTETSQGVSNSTQNTTETSQGTNDTTSQTETGASSENSNATETDYDKYADEFGAWVAAQSFESYFICRFEIQMAAPFPEVDHDLWAIWANHDCLGWEVDLIIMMEKEVSDSVISAAGVVYSDDDGCQRYETHSGRQYDQCKFKIGRDADNFGLLIKGGFAPIWYEYEWTYLGEFSWMKYFYPY